MLNDYYRRASVYVQASAHEGFGLSVAEGMLAGCIPVTTRAGALPEVVGDVGIQVDGTGPGAARGGDRPGARGRRPTSGRRRGSACSGDFPLEIRREGVQALVAETLEPVIRSRAAMTVNLFSDTQTRPTEAMRRAMAQAEVGDEQRFDDPTVNELQERVAALLGKEAALLLPSGTMCNAIGFRLHVRPGRRRGDPRSHVPPGAVRGRGPGGAVRSDAPRSRRRRGHLHRGAGGGCGAAGRRPLRASLPARVRRADDEHRRRPGVASGSTARRRRRRLTPRVAIAPRRGPPDERRGRERRAGGRSRARIRHRLAGLHQGPRRAGRRGAGRVPRPDRRGMALQADDGRRDAAGRSAGGGRAARPRPPRRAARHRSRQRPPPGRRAGRDRRACASIRTGSRPTSSFSRSPTRTRSAAVCGSAGSSSRRSTRGDCGR